MTTRESLTAAILLNPGDMLARQVWADHVMESPDCTPAEESFCEYVRAWVALERAPKRVPCPNLPHSPSSSLWLAVGHSCASCCGTGTVVNRELWELDTRLDDLRTQHEASWRRRECEKCEGSRFVTANVYGRTDHVPTGTTAIFCPQCNGTGATGPLSAIEETRHGSPEIYMQRKWRHSVSWEPFPVVTCRLDEMGSVVCRSCHGTKQVQVYTRDGDYELADCWSCGNPQNRVWVPSPFAVGVVRMGGTFAVSDKIPNDYGPPEDGCRYGWLSEHEHGVGFAGLPRCVLRSIPPTGQRYAGRYSTSDAASLALSRCLLALTLPQAFPGWAPQAQEAKAHE